jgi:hypothetical protein
MGKLLPSEWGPVLGPSKELYPDCVIDSDHEFVFSAAIAASFNNSFNSDRLFRWRSKTGRLS